LKLTLRLFKSHHGVYYYRFQFQHQTRRKECRISLRTKNPTIYSTNRHRRMSVTPATSQIRFERRPSDAYLETKPKRALG